MRYFFILLLLSGCIQYHNIESSTILGDMINIKNMSDTHKFNIQYQKDKKNFYMIIDDGLCQGDIEVFFYDYNEISSLDGMVPCNDGTIFNFVQSENFVENTSTNKKYKIKNIQWMNN